MAEYYFALDGVALPETDSLFGIWKIVKPPSGSPQDGAEVSFAPGTSKVPTEPVWRVRLPAPSDAARALLEAQSVALRRSAADLAQAERRLAQIGEGVSFAATAGPEAELLATLRALETPVPFGLGREEAERRRIGRQWQEFLEQVRRLVSHYARIETEIAGALVGHTAVGWTGDFDTLWESDITPQAMQLHLQAVHLALGSRIALLRLLIVVGTGAAKLALRLAVPGAQLLVLPAVWKFVRDVLRELRQSWPQIQS